MNKKLGPRYIVIEGVIGVGKTTLTRMLAEEVDAKPVFEKPDTNPFLEDFYKDPERFAFQTQLFFLLSRYRQQQELFQSELFYDYLISDYLFAKDRIFATLNLGDRELLLYDKIAVLLEEGILKPDLVVYLQSNPERLMKNIRKRGRSYEKELTEEYIRSLNEVYNSFFFRYTDTPLLIVNATEIDFVQKKEHFLDLARQILQPRSGTEFYHPANVGA